MKRVLSLVLLAMLVLGPAVTAAAQETTTTSTTAGPSTTLPEAAVPIVPAAPVPEEAPWTWRFIIPTLMVVIVALMVGLGASYYPRIKSRYRVVR